MYSLLKYGDLYLRLVRESDMKKAFLFDDTTEVDTRQSLREELFNKNKILNEDVILNVPNKNDKFAKYLEKIDNPGEMFDLTKYDKSVMYIKAPYTVWQDTTKNTNIGVVADTQ